MFAGTSNTREAMEIMMAPCMPFLLAWPGIASVMLFTEHGSNPEVGGLMTACILGTIGYAVAAVVLTVSAIEQFDEKSGRIQRGSGHSLHVRNSPPSGQPVRPNHKSA
jgi:hypothetical protein